MASQPSPKSRSSKASKLTPASKITPLMIIAGFGGLTEAVLGAALTQVSGGVQYALTTFVCFFPVAVAAGFFIVLWDRAWVFYSPAEYGETDPKHFAAAMKNILPEQVADKLRQVEAKPDDPETQYWLIDSLIENSVRQHLILMMEKQIEFPYADYRQNVYQIGGTHTFSSGGMSGIEFAKKLAGTRLVEIDPVGPSVKLTKTGRDFAVWLVKTDKKAEFFQSRLGGWGTPVYPQGMVVPGQLVPSLVRSDHVTNPFPGANAPNDATSQSETTSSDSA